MKTDDIAKNGRCIKHNELLVICHECENAYQLAANAEWIQRWKIAAQVYRANQAAIKTYYAMTTGLVEHD